MNFPWFWVIMIAIMPLFENRIVCLKITQIAHEIQDLFVNTNNNTAC